ncbi:enoyl-CoA hydratase/isomerase family protein [Neorhizobium sp. T786]|uniref:enoyl-CoA hydratase/isomerase family protein n=1 Tax=Pseudorhizobium xiangyangii TaxID=2883104 RepID=UPI001CFFBC0E|nr:enoyl-CoA hydratase/isomerase family protein [Neorhizobium xiangyangii]MCB5203774.1 enoyl-CoA hydratase/isomerase family protein [Neorhizobium xiangyangii]
MSIEFDVQDCIALITINRPERRNALDADHYAALSDAWCRVRDDAGIQVAVVTGAGDRAFCAGADLKSWVGRDNPLSELWLTQKDSLLNRGLEVWKPVIAAVNGACVAGGMTLLLGTDLRVAVSGATFSLAEVKRGIIAANGGTQRVMKQLPYAIAMEILLLGESIDADTAARWGLINRVVEPEDLLSTAMEMARKIQRNAPLAVQAAKELAIRSQDMSLADGLRMEQFVNRILHHSEDTRLAREAFAEKRQPQFKGN